MRLFFSKKHKLCDIFCCSKSFTSKLNGNVNNEICQPEDVLVFYDYTDGNSFNSNRLQPLRQSFAEISEMIHLENAKNGSKDNVSQLRIA